ncbi:MAG: hypothetical protein NW214_09615 [Pseudanabaenaceae cyanobacterium bins.39]|nr:hypothetical protein [Pseudanabaenaceae cyanobacterium bins.39]
MHKPISLQHFLAIAFTSVALCLYGCNNNNESATSATRPEVVPISENAKQLEAEIAEVKLSQSKATTPIKIVVAIDQSGSMQGARVNYVNFADLQPIFQKLEESGGEIALSAICDRSNRPLVRLAFSEPPKLDDKFLTLPAPVSKLVDEGSPFEKEEREKAYAAKLASYNSQIEQKSREIATHKKQLQQHRQEAKKRIEVVKPEIEEILKTPRNCQATDIQSSLNRAKWYFEEATPKSHKRFALFITDGLDSFSEAPANLPADARVILVNGSVNVGIFGKIKHDRFESPKRAITHLVDLI